MYNYELEINYDTDEEYKKSFLDAFDVKDIDDAGEKRKELYVTLNKLDEFNDLFTFTSPPFPCPFIEESYNENDNEWGMIILFSYDYFKFFHKCIQMYFKNNKITDELTNEINGLKKIIEKG
jgi:hypothetical protein